MNPSLTINATRASCREAVAFRCIESDSNLQEEGIVNNLQRKLEQVTQAYHALEERVEAHGLSLKSLQPLPSVDVDTE